MQLPSLAYLAVAALGLVFGSFFNVAIYRWPNEDKKEREWIFTPSHCPKCGKRIRAYDNIPLISYLVLRGRCRDCHAPISWRYPAVEAASALLFLLTAWLVSTYGLSGVAVKDITIWHYVFALIFASLFFLTVVIDFQTSLIPEQITVSLFIAAWIFMLVCQGHTISPGWLASLIGMAVLSAFFFIFAFFGAMGGGDVMLAAGLGVLFGWQLVITAGFIGICIGGAVGIVLLLYLIFTKRYKKRGIPIPFGPYLAVSSYICMFAGWQILHWYLGLFGLAGNAPAGLP